MRVLFTDGLSCETYRYTDSNRMTYFNELLRKFSAEREREREAGVEGVGRRKRKNGGHSERETDTDRRRQSWHV